MPNAGDLSLVSNQRRREVAPYSEITERRCRAWPRPRPNPHLLSVQGLLKAADDLGDAADHHPRSGKERVAIVERRASVLDGYVDGTVGIGFEFMLREPTLDLEAGQFAFLFQKSVLGHGEPLQAASGGKGFDAGGSC